MITHETCFANFSFNSANMLLGDDELDEDLFVEAGLIRVRVDK
jgi:hypothetical protein